MKKILSPSFNKLVPSWDWLSAILLLSVLYLTSERLIITAWADHLAIIQMIVLIAGVFGIALGLSGFKKQTIIYLGLGFGLFIIIWQLGITLSAGFEWLERLSILWDRLIFTFDQLITQEVIYDPLLFLISMAVLFYGIGITAGYGVARSRNPWQVIIPAGLTIVVLHSFDSKIISRIWYLALFLFFGLILVARILFLKNNSLWKAEKTHVPLYAAFNMLPVTIGLTAILILTAWGIPALAKAFDPAERAWQKLTEPWREVSQEIEEAFDSLQYSIAGISNVYGDTLLLGEGTAKSETLILEIETPIRSSPHIRFYWRARTYDYYDPFDQGWEITSEITQDFSPIDESINSPNYQDRWESDFNVTVYHPITVLFIAQEPTWLSRPSTLLIDPIENGLENEVNYIRSENPIYTGENYQFTAEITNSNIRNLNGAGTTYPDWILDKYLQLPENTTAGTIALAETISEDLETPYEIADAITTYLRENIEYSETIPPFPEDRDPIDWILFDLKQGFCNYYATAEVVLLRSLGIPARLAVGYAQGELFYDLADAEGVFAKPEDIDGNGEEGNVSGERYLVRQSDLHAWPEVFFPGIGWVEFEPTLDQDPLVRSEESTDVFIIDELINEPENLEENTLNSEADLIDPESSLAGIEEGNSIRRLSTILLVIFSIAIGGFAILQRNSNAGLIQPFPVLVEKGLLRLNITPPKAIRNWSLAAQLSTLSKSYMEINRALRRLDQAAGLEATPAERGTALAVLLPTLSDPIDLLLKQYQIGEYGLEETDLNLAITASREIRNLSMKHWFKNVITNINNFWKKDLNNR